MISFPDKKYQIIYADPPYHYQNWENKTASRWVGNKYPTMKFDDICKLPIQDICDKNCVLFLWVTPPCLMEAIKVISAWGFTYKTKAFCWIKKNKKTDSVFWGMGYWTRSNTEDCLLATKGITKRINAGVHQIIETPIREHSRKPDEVRNGIVQLLGDLPRIELFARPPIPEGWDAWGNEI
jgi:N6-adenosine-specific RNA methylase IME4